MKLYLSFALFLFVRYTLPADGSDGATAEEDFVRALYKPYGTGADTYYLGKRAPAVFASELLTLIRADQKVPPGGIGRLDEDPLCECQDDDGFRLTSIKTRRLSGNQATAKVSFAIGVFRDVITLDLVTGDHGWRIADIHSAEMPSLVSFLSKAPSSP